MEGSSSRVVSGSVSDLPVVRRQKPHGKVEETLTHGDDQRNVRCNRAQNTLERGGERGGNQDRREEARSSMVVDRAAHRRRGDYRLVAVVEQNDRQPNDGNSKWRRRGLHRRHDAHSIKSREKSGGQAWRTTMTSGSRASR